MQAAVAGEIQQNSNIQIASLDINCLVTVSDFIWAASKPSAQNESSLLKLSMQVGYQCPLTRERTMRAKLEPMFQKVL